MDQKMNEGFNYLKNDINDTKKMMINGFDNIKDDIKDVRHEIKENNFYIYNKIDDLNNKYIQQTNKFNDELKNQDKK